jgi:hypothetical protein
MRARAVHTVLTMVVRSAPKDRFTELSRMMEQKRVVIRVWCLIDQKNMSRCEGEIEKAGGKVKKVTKSRQQVKEEKGKEALLRTGNVVRLMTARIWGNHHDAILLLLLLSYYYHYFFSFLLSD